MFEGDVALGRAVELGWILVGRKSGFELTELVSDVWGFPE
jgi:hypothetical protein